MKNHLKIIHEQASGPFHLELWGKATETSLEKEDLTRVDLQAISQKKKQKILFLRQVHGAKVIEVPTENYNSLYWKEADAFFSQSQRHCSAIRIADCIPVLFWHNNPMLYGGIHAGWRGLHQKIISATIHRLKQYVDIGALNLWVGPHIGPGYEVGPDVYENFDSKFSREGERPNKRYLVLADVLKQEFTDLGIKEQQVTWYASDTLADPSLFSHRGGDKGRNIALVYPG